MLIRKTILHFYAGENLRVFIESVVANKEFERDT